MDDGRVSGIGYRVSGIGYRVYILILAATIAAVALRLPRLEQRPMHGDEAIHAEKFRLLLEEGFYSYDSQQYHGPTLNYLTLIPAWLGSAEKLTEVTELTLRIVPVFFAVCLVLLVLLVVDGLGRPAAIIAAALTAVSPAFVFYSRYYIQEMLLVCFTFGVITCGYRYAQSRNIRWALLTGVFLGLCHATKETCIIAFGSMLLALFFTVMIRWRQEGSISENLKTMKFRHCFAAVAVAVTVSALFYSSFLTNAGGVFDSLRTYGAYFSRAGNSSLHIHPWYYYLKMLIYYRYAGGPVWSEALIVLLAGIGFVVVMTRKGLHTAQMANGKWQMANRKWRLAIGDKQFARSGLLMFIAFYTLVMTSVYSVIPYKTPWCLLGFLHGMILLAAVGAVAVIKLVPNVLARTIVSLLLVAGGAHLAWQGWLGSYRFYTDSRNPYVYAHPTTDVFGIAQRVEQIAQVHPDGPDMHIQVICPEDDYWPLPWYLRSFTRVGWWNKVDENVPAAPLIIASASVESALMRKLYELRPPGQRSLYVPLFDTYMELRPQVELRGYVTKELWDRIQQKKDPT